VWSYRPALDGLRAVAIYLVLLFHAGLPGVAGGFIGVDVFFVLSGFLVTNVILSEFDRTGTLGLGGFYSRRVRRLLPAALLVIVATTVIFLIIATVVRRLPMVGDAQSALLYVANWHFLVTSNDYFAAENDPSPFLHFWSLSIEEQFYFFFPALVLLVSRIGAGWERTLARVVAVLIVASIGSQLVWSQVNANHAYYGTDARIYQLLAGVLLAIVLRRWASSGEAPPARLRLIAMASTVGIVALALFASDLLDLTPTWRGLGATASTVAVIAGLSLVPGAWLTRLLSLPIPVYLGKISYGTYLWHWPVILVLQQLLAVGPWTIAVLAFALSTGLAALSFQIFESPIRRSTVLNRFGWSVLAVGVMASVLVAVSVPAALESTRKPSVVAAGGQLTKQVDASLEGRQPVPDIDFAAVSDDVGAVRTCPADRPDLCTVVRGRGPHLLLVGDSQAEMFGPMLTRLAKSRGFTFSENVLSGCAWTTGVVNTKVSEGLQRACAESRDEWYERALPKLKPDVILLVQKPREEKQWADQLANADGTKASQSQMLSRAAQRTLDQLGKGPWKVLVLETVLTPGRFRVVDCLAEAKTVGRCAVPLPRDYPDSDAVYRVAAAERDDVWTANINSVICPEGPLCLPIRDGAVVWRDREHLTVSFTQRFRNEIWSELKKSGALRDFR
jgi:peptidoglycan/LPS O-acetylase OafA/YrhL